MLLQDLSIFTEEKGVIKDLPFVYGGASSSATREAMIPVYEEFIAKCNAIGIDDETLKQCNLYMLQSVSDWTEYSSCCVVFGVLPSGKTKPMMCVNAMGQYAFSYWLEKLGIAQLGGIYNLPKKDVELNVNMYNWYKDKQ